jgi:hypothetical protein
MEISKMTATGVKLEKKFSGETIVAVLISGFVTPTIAGQV